MLRVITAVGCLVLLWACPAGAGLLSVPAGYTPEKAWPVIVSYQDNPSVEQMKTVPYFLVHAGGQGATATKKTTEYLLDLAKRYNIDPSRIYGTGFSRGGQEVLIQAWQHPHWFAAVAPVCSDLREKPDRNRRDLNVKYMHNVPALMLHGEGDSFRRTGRIEYELMKAAGGNVTWQSYAGGHSPQLPFKQNVKMLTDFFDKHKLNPYPKKVVHLIEQPAHSRAFWVDAALVKPARGVKAVLSVQVAPGNRIVLAANEHVSAVALHLNGKLVDMKKPVTVVLTELPAILRPWLQPGPEPAAQTPSTSPQAAERELYRGPAVSPLKIKLREGMPLARRPRKLLWEEIVAIRAKAKADGDSPAKPKTPKPTPGQGPR